MNGYTSGKTTHDPQPYALCSPGVFGVRSSKDGGRSPMGWEWIYSPRHEFDNHNPILSDLRENGDIAGHLEFCTDRHSAGHYSTPFGKAHIAHARRVLTKLAALHE